MVSRLISYSAMLECSVDKPGNVGPSHDFDDTSYGDYILSSLMLGEVAGYVESIQKRRSMVDRFKHGRPESAPVCEYN